MWWRKQRRRPVTREELIAFNARLEELANTAEGLAVHAPLVNERFSTREYYAGKAVAYREAREVILRWISR